MKHNHSNTEVNNKPPKNISGKYACPMHYENDKVYNKPGNWYVCGIPKKNISKLEKMICEIYNTFP